MPLPDLVEQRRISQLAGHAVLTAWLQPPSAWGALVLAHGKVDDLDHPSLLAAAQGAFEAGWACLRFNFPYRQRGEQEPDDFAVLISVHRAACGHALGMLSGGGLALGGKSQGSRTALALAPDLDADAHVLLGYPLHPARQPGQVAAAPLEALRAPLLLVQGERDPLCRPQVLQKVLSGLTIPQRLWTVPGGSHAFALPGGAQAQEAVWQGIRRETREFLSVV